ncbi:MAG: sodium:solute symporter family protein [Hyphomicrobium sp.]
MNAVLIGVLFYVLLQFAIGAWVARRIFTERDYINAGRKIGIVIASFSVFATWFGAEVIVGAAGAVYAEGLPGATIDPFGYAAALVIVGLTVAAPLWNRGYVTFADFFRDRYSQAVERLAVLLILPGPLIWGAAQIRAFGQVMGSVADVSLLTGIVIATVIVIAYTVLGGLMADALTDFIQAIAVILGLVILAIVVSGEVGGFTAGLANVEPQRLAYFVADDRGSLERLEEWAIPIFGTMVSVELIARVLGTNSARTARNACILGGVLYLCVGLIPVYLGLIGPSVLPGLAQPEQIVPSLAEKFLPTFFFVIFAGALISAILSTVDSALLSGGSIVSHNLLVPMRPELSEAARVRFARGSVIVLGLIAFDIALRSTTIHDLVETASAIGSAGLIVVALFGLFTRFGGPAAAASALVTGAVVWLAAIVLEFTSVPYVFAVAMAAVAYVGAGLLVRRPG